MKIVIKKNENKLHFIGHKHEAPDYMQDNEFVLSGYRINFNSTKRIFSSLFMVHNESVNIWSHLIGVYFFIALIGYTFFYLAPPEMEQGLGATTMFNNAPGWFSDSTFAHDRDTAMLNTLLSGESDSITN